MPHTYFRQQNYMISRIETFKNVEQTGSRYFIIIYTHKPVVFYTMKSGLYWVPF